MQIVVVKPAFYKVRPVISLEVIQIRGVWFRVWGIENRDSGRPVISLEVIKSDHIAHAKPLEDPDEILGPPQMLVPHVWPPESNELRTDLVEAVTGRIIHGEVLVEVESAEVEPRG